MHPARTPTQQELTDVLEFVVDEAVVGEMTPRQKFREHYQQRLAESTIEVIDNYPRYRKVLWIHWANSNPALSEAFIWAWGRVRCLGGVAGKYQEKDQQSA